MKNKVYMIYEDDDCNLDSVALFRVESAATKEMMNRAYSILAEILDDEPSNSGIYWESMTTEEKDKFFKEQILATYHIKELIINETDEN